MKKQTLTLLLAVATTFGFAQGQKWATGGNSNSTGDIFGTTNAQPINFTTNNTLRMVLDANGNLRMVNFAGVGSRFLQTDLNGNLIPFAAGTSTQVLYGNGVWGALPTITGNWLTSGNNLYWNSGNVGIGAAPSNTYKLDVAGDARIQNNLIVNGGILISQKVEATNSLKTDTVHSASGSTKFMSNVVLKQQFQVDGNALFNGALQAGVLNAGTLNVSGNTVFTNTITAMQGINLGNNTMLRTFVSPTPGVGNITLLSSPPSSGNDPSPPPACVVGQVPGWISNGSNGFYTLSNGGSGTNYAYFTQYVNNTNGNSYIDASGTINGSTPAALYINKNCNSNTFINTNGGIVNMGNTVNMSRDVFIGSTGNPGNLSVGDITSNSGSLRVFQNTSSSAGIKLFVDNINSTAFQLINSNSSSTNISSINFNIKASGQTQIGATAGVAAILNVKGDVNTITNCFETNHTVDFGYNTKIVVNRDLTKALGIFNNATGNALERFRINGNGQTIINCNGYTNTTDMIILTTDANNSPSNLAAINFKVKANGEVYSRYMKVSVNAFPDYVFAKTYKLPSLKEVEAYYKANKHLPEIPTANEVEKEGLDLGMINTLLVKKVEELTIYAVEQNKTTEAQQALLVELQKQIEALKKQIDKK